MGIEKENEAWTGNVQVIRIQAFHLQQIYLLIRNPTGHAGPKTLARPQIVQK